ncbi:3'(2'),5'-bisphosphate nucleotidase CysQ [Porticoccus sp.]
MAETEVRQVDFGLLKQVMLLAESAGKVIMSFYADIEDLKVDTKVDQSPVTAADLAANRLLVSQLPTLLRVPVLSEESTVPPYEVRSAWHRYWLVDPLDGTREFLSGNGEFTVNVALIEDGCPVLGVVYVPTTGTGYAGLSGKGAYQYTGGRYNAIHVRTMVERQAEGLPLVVVASRRQGGGQVAQLQSQLSPQFGDVVVRQVGSSLKLCLIAEGAADLYPHFWPTSEWDTAAGQAVVEAAGGEVVAMNRQPLAYNTRESLLNPYFYSMGDKGCGWDAILPFMPQDLE